MADFASEQPAISIDSGMSISAISKLLSTLHPSVRVRIMIPDYPGDPAGKNEAPPEAILHCVRTVFSKDPLLIPNSCNILLISSLFQQRLGLNLVFQ